MVVEKLINDSVFEGSNPGTACNAREKIEGKYFDARPEEIAQFKIQLLLALGDVALEASPLLLQRRGLHLQTLGLG